VHLASSGFPIAGDEKYGDFTLNKQLQKATDTRGALRRMFLHAWQITFAHPESGQPLTLQAPLAPECQRFLVSLGPAAEPGRTSNDNE
jgi:23S rRNA pseudouridine955/2504/2580 synthase